jgi:hypothetical protein
VFQRLLQQRLLSVALPAPVRSELQGIRQKSAEVSLKSFAIRKKLFDTAR